jgi:hypothetical protein
MKPSAAFVFSVSTLINEANTFSSFCSRVTERQIQSRRQPPVETKSSYTHSQAPAQFTDLWDISSRAEGVIVYCCCHIRTFYQRLRPVSQLVFNEPLSPIAPRHCMFNCPSVTLSSVPSSCAFSEEDFSSRRNATWRVSLGCRTGAFTSSEAVLKVSQFRERHWKDWVGFILTA